MYRIEVEVWLMEIPVYTKNRTTITRAFEVKECMFDQIRVGEVIQECIEVLFGIEMINETILNHITEFIEWLPLDGLPPGEVLFKCSRRFTSKKYSNIGTPIGVSIELRETH